MKSIIYINHCGLYSLVKPAENEGPEDRGLGQRCFKIGEGLACTVAVLCSAEMKRKFLMRKVRLVLERIEYKQLAWISCIA